MSQGVTCASTGFLCCTIDLRAFSAAACFASFFDLWIGLAVSFALSLRGKLPPYETFYGPELSFLLVQQKLEELPSVEHREARQHFETGQENKVTGFRYR